MRPLAEFLMRGRINAFAVATIALLLPMFYWIGAAVVALVTLRKGTKEGGALLMWCTLPAVAVLLYQGEIMPLVCLPGAFIGAGILRNSQSWSQALIGISITGVLLSILLSLAGGAILEYLAEEIRAQVLVVIDSFLAQSALETHKTEFVAAVNEFINTTFTAGSVGSNVVLLNIITLIAARWMQAMLYNPGGFEKEFKQLRFNRVQATGLFIAIAMCVAISLSFSSWSGIFLTPLVFAGIALVHNIIYKKNIGELWLTILYGLLLLVDPFKLVMAIVALLDSWFNFRGRLPQPPEDKPEP